MAPGATGFERPARPDVKIGAILMIAGAALAAIGIYLPWVTGNASQNGTGFFITEDGSGSLTTLDNPSVAVWLFVVILLGLGIALFFAGRVLAVAIIGIVVAAIAVFVGIGMLGVSASASDFNEDPAAGVGIGAIIQPIGPLIALAGAIVATAKRRR